VLSARKNNFVLTKTIPFFRPFGVAIAANTNIKIIILNGI